MAIAALDGSGISHIGDVVVATKRNIDSAKGAENRTNARKGQKIEWSVVRRESCAWKTKAQSRNRRVVC